MKRVRRLASLWSWLPAFRVVAETQHLPTAAEQLFVTPSALSRSIRLLEDELGAALFDRLGRRLVLNEAGQELLRATRAAMRRLDDAVSALTEEGLLGAFRIAGPSPYLQLTLPALKLLSREHPRFVPHLTSADPAACNAALLAGSLDLALLDDPIAHDRLTITALVDLAHGVYCGPGHPLFPRQGVELADVLEHAFAGPNGRDPHWPAHLERRLGLVASELQVAAHACSLGHYLAVLPSTVAEIWPGPGELRRLPIEVFTPTPLCAVHRVTLTDSGPTELVRDTLAALLS